MLDAPTHGKGAGGYLDLSADLNGAGETFEALAEHATGSIRVMAGPAALPIDEVERWSKGFLKLVFALPAEGSETSDGHVRSSGRTAGARR